MLFRPLVKTILSDLSPAVVKQREKLGEFKRDPVEFEEHLGSDRFTRPIVNLELGEYGGGQYQGEWATSEDGQINLHGWGTLVLNDLQNGSSLVEGYFQNGAPNGRCREITDRYTYEGEMQDGLKHGEGTESSGRSKYEGSWEYDMKEGKGILTQFGSDNNDFIIEGYWKDNYLDGLAVHRYGGKTQDVIYKKGECLFDFDDGNTNPDDKIGHIP